MDKTQTATECRFCAFMQNQSGSLEIDNPWVANEHFSAFVSVGALTQGWTLVLPQHHTLNMSAEYALPDFWEFAAQVSAAVEKQYGPVSVFEHGTQATNSITGCGTGHAHLHIVPLSFSLCEAAAQYDHQLSWVRCKASDIERFVEGQEYLFVADRFDGETTEGLLCALKEPTSQFFRRVIAAQLGLPELYDYKRFQMLDIATASYRKLKSSVVATRLAQVA